MRLFLQYHANGSNIRHLKAENGILSSKVFDDLEEDEKAKRRERHEKYKDQKTPVSQSNSLLEDWIVQIIHFCTGYRSD